MEKLIFSPDLREKSSFFQVNLGEYGVKTTAHTLHMNYLRQALILVRGNNGYFTGMQHLFLKEN